MDARRSADRFFIFFNFGCSPSRSFSHHHVTDSRQCLPITARRPCQLLRGRSMPYLITQPHPPHHLPPARRPPSAAGFPMAASRRLAPRTRGARSTASPSCFRLDSQGRRSPSTPEMCHCPPSGSSSAPSWIRSFLNVDFLGCTTRSCSSVTT